MTSIVDTNVAIVANKRAEQASPECIAACASRLEQLMDSGRIAIDDKFLIIKEYRTHLRTEGQPGVGDRFLRWVLLNRTNSERCDQITIMPTDDNSFREFPSDDRLKTFDRADRKWIAVCAAHPEHPPILQATDSKWLLFEKTFADNNIRIEFACPDDVKRLLQQG